MALPGIKQSSKKTALRLFGPPIIGDILANQLPDDPKVKKSSLLLGQGDPNAGFKTGELPTDFKVKDRFQQAEPSTFSNIGEAIIPLKRTAESLLLNSIAPGAGTALSTARGITDEAINDSELNKDQSLNFSPKENINLNSFNQDLGFGKFNKNFQSLLLDL